MISGPKHTLTATALLTALTSAPLAAQEPPANPAPPAQQQQPPANGTEAVPPAQDFDAAFAQSGGSLYRVRGNPAAPGQRPPPTGYDAMFAVKPPEPKKVRKFDLITVIVREESDAKTESKTDLKKETDFNALLEQYIKFSMGDLALKGREPLANQPQLKFQLDRNFSGEGKLDRSDSMSARVQAQVIDVKPNGILVIQATKMIKNDEEEQRFTLTGMVRAEDVTPDNSVLSTQLADLYLEKNTTGAARDSSKRGWIPRFFDMLNLF